MVKRYEERDRSDVTGFPVDALKSGTGYVQRSPTMNGASFACVAQHDLNSGPKALPPQ